MEIEVTLRRIKVTPPRLMIYMDGPYFESQEAEAKALDEKLRAAVDEFNQKVREIVGDSDSYENSLNWWFPNWMTNEDKALYMVSWENFRSHMTHLAAERYALYLERTRLNESVKLPEVNPESSTAAGPA